MQREECGTVGKCFEFRAELDCRLLFFPNKHRMSDLFGATNVLKSDKISVMCLLMETTVTELLREFPRVRRAALSGETVIIKSREGNLRLSLDAPATGSLIGCMRGLLARADDDIDGPTSDAGNWDSDL